MLEVWGCNMAQEDSKSIVYENPRGDVSFDEFDDFSENFCDYEEDQILTSCRYCMLQSLQQTQ